MKTIKIIYWALLGGIFFVACSPSKSSESGEERAERAPSAKYHIYMDLAHKPVFWNDPKDMTGKPVDQVERINYMTGELLKNAQSLNADVSYLKKEIKPEDLKDCDLLFIHIPSATYKAGEVQAITEYLEKGGSLFLVMDSEYWSSLDQTKVNDLIRKFGVEYGGNNPDTLAGGYAEPGAIVKERLKLSYHGARIVKGGTPFCYSAHMRENPFGVYKELDGGGKLVVMGDGMTSLYMTSWQGVNDYQCSEFMEAVLGWLLE